jgi:hypothetical protein
MAKEEHSGMSGKCSKVAWEYFDYLRKLLSEALATSERLVGVGSKIQAAVLVLIPAGTITAIGVKFHFTLQEWLYYPGGLFLLWIMFLMLIAAFKKHRQQERCIAELKQAAEPKLSIGRVSRIPKPSGGYSCQVTIANGSMEKAENVSVRLGGNKEIGDALGNYNPFSDPILTPLGSATINPKSESDWMFPKAFNYIAEMLANKQVLRTGSELKVEDQVDLEFSLTISSSSSPPKRSLLFFGRDESGHSTVKMRVRDLSV